MTTWHDLTTADGRLAFNLERVAHRVLFGVVVVDLQHDPQSFVPAQGRVLSRGEVTELDAEQAERQQAQVKLQAQVQSLKRKRRVRARLKKGGKA